MSSNTELKEWLRLYADRDIVDVTKPVVVRVLQRHCDEGRQRDPRFCAIAQSLREKADVLDVRVGAGIVYVVYPKRVLRGILSKQDMRRVFAFDASGFFAPCTVTLLKPPSSSRPQSVRSGKKQPRRAPRKRVARPSLRHISHVGTE